METTFLHSYGCHQGTCNKKGSVIPSTGLILWLVTYEHHVGLLEVGDADLLGGHDLQEGEEHHGQQGGHWQGDALRHPVHSLEWGNSQRK